MLVEAVETESEMKEADIVVCRNCTLLPRLFRAVLLLIYKSNVSIITRNTT